MSGFGSSIPPGSEPLPERPMARGPAPAPAPASVPNHLDEADDGEEDETAAQRQRLEALGWLVADTNAGLALVTGTTVVAVRITTVDAALADHLEWLVRAMLGDTRLRLVGNATQLLVCRCAAPIPSDIMRASLPDGRSIVVEILGAGRSFVAFPLGEPWFDANPMNGIDALPATDAAQVAAFRAQVGTDLRERGAVLEPDHPADVGVAIPDAGAARFAVTFFTSHAATTKRQEMLSLTALRERIATTDAPSKAALPWLKLATFGDVRTKHGSFRHNDNMLAIAGVEADYDAEQLGVAEACTRLRSAGMLALVYTSPSHTEDAPRWRVLCPLSQEYPPEARDKFMSRLSGLFGGVFSNESWTLSQSYYFGSVARNLSHRAEVIDGVCLDLLDALDATAIGRPKDRGVGRVPQPQAKPEDIAEARVQGVIRTLLGNINAAPDGQKHTRLRDNCLSVGGYLHLTGWTVEEAVEQAVAALPSSVDDWDQARVTAEWAISRGMARPLELEDRPNLYRTSTYGYPADQRRAARPNGAGKPEDVGAEQSAGRHHADDAVSLEEQDEAPPHEPEPSEPGAKLPSDTLRGAVLPPELHGCPLTEDGVAQAFAIEHGDDLRFCHGPNRWHVWDGTRWKPEPTQLAFHWVRTLARRMARAAGKASLRATLGKATFAAGVERFARTDRTFAVSPELWDRDPWLLGTPGGTVDLRTGELRPAAREDYISRQTLVTPAEPGTPCPVWDRFLAEATRDDAELIGFIDRWFGYSLTGVTFEEALTFLHGPGGNGKGVLMHAIFAIMGDYAVNAAIDAFTVTFADKHTTDIAMLNGARLVVATEIEEGRAWAEARIKSLTGRDPITARFMRQDNVTFVPIFKLTISGNHKPRLRNVDEAAKRRINMVPFLNRPSVIDTKLAERLEPEYPAILRRLIGGCISWQTSGLMRPKVVTDATAEYFETEDYFTRWLDESCTILPQLTERPGKLLASFQAWCKTNGEEETDNRRLRGMLERVPGVKYVKAHRGAREFRGIALNPPSEPDGRYG